MPKESRCNTDTTSLSREIWKDVEGFEGLYQVSNFGRVKSLERITEVRNVYRSKRKTKFTCTEHWRRKGKILEPIHQGRTRYVRLYRLDHTRYSVPIKVLVAKHFLQDYTETTKTVDVCYRETSFYYPDRVSNIYIKKSL